MDAERIAELRSKTFAARAVLMPAGTIDELLDALEAAQARIIELEHKLEWEVELSNSITKYASAWATLADAPDNTVIGVEWGSIKAKNAEIKELQARIAMLEAELRRVEWVGGICLSCLEREGHGHDADCPLRAALGESNGN